MATLKDAENYLVEMENSFVSLKDKFGSKQGDRLLLSHVWMGDYLDQQIAKVQPFSDSVATLRDRHVGDFKSSTQFDTLISHCDEITKLLNGIANVHKMKLGITDVKLRWNYNLRSLAEKIKSTRNRFNIIKGQLTSVQIGDDW